MTTMDIGIYNWYWYIYIILISLIGQVRKCYPILSKKVTEGLRQYLLWYHGFHRVLYKYEGCSYANFEWLNDYATW